MQALLTPKAKKHLKKIPPPEKAKIRKKILLLEKRPLLGKKLDGEYAELRSVRAWPYRIFYYISESENTLYIVSVKHRQEAYK